MADQEYKRSQKKARDVRGLGQECKRVDQEGGSRVHEGWVWSAKVVG